MFAGNFGGGGGGLKFSLFLGPKFPPRNVESTRAKDQILKKYFGQNVKF